jgi:SWI/SNF-related matrix-associated actin-dependent regulator of chromatin subfamily A-like protein 1
MMKKRKLYPFQREGVRLIEKFEGRALLADDMGLGKTAQALCWLKKHPEIKHVVVVCPASVKFHWEREAREWAGIRAEVLNGRKPPDDYQHRIYSSRMLILNYDIAYGWIEYLSRLNPELLIIDEGHYCANPAAQRTKAITMLSRGVPFIIITTGTAVVNRPAEIWPCLNILKPKKFKNFHPFGWEYCDPHMKRGKWQYRGATNLDKLHRILKKHGMIRRLKSEVLKELPKKSRFIIPLDMKDDRDYLEATSDFMAWIRRTEGESKALRIKSAQRLVEMGVLKQLAAEAKMPFVFEWIDSFLEDTDEKLVVVGWHKKIIRMLRERYPGMNVVIDGSVSGKKRDKAIDQFVHDKQKRLCFGNMRAMGTGTDGLQVAQTMAVIELGWNPGQHSQLEARLDRIGQKGATSIYYLIARNTIEEWLCELIQKKQDNVSHILDGAPSHDDLDLFDALQDKVIEHARSIRGLEGSVSNLHGGNGKSKGSNRQGRRRQRA